MWLPYGRSNYTFIATVVVYDYTDFGETTAVGEVTVDNQICYTGAMFDAAAVLYYFNERYYNSPPNDERVEDGLMQEKIKSVIWLLSTARIKSVKSEVIKFIINAAISK